MIEEIFKNNNLKITKHRIDIYNLILNQNSVSLEEIENNLKIDKSTIYRILKIFLEKNIISETINNNKKIYMLNTNKHIHYITCVKCHKKIKVDLDQAINDECKKNNIKLINHSVYLEGLCKSCDK